MVKVNWNTTYIALDSAKHQSYIGHYLVTLFRQLIIAIITLFVILYGFETGFSIYQSRQLVEQQMVVHAQDTATSLALSMSQAAHGQDNATLETLFNAISDSGYYKNIYFTDLDGKIVIDRSFPVQIEGVPDWFIDLIDIGTHQGSAEVSSGWTRLGELTVVSHPGQFYLRLWQQNKELLLLFSLITFVVCILAAIALSLILRPLARVEKQANAIFNKEFVIQKTLPASRELRSVVLAINRMTIQLKSIFDSQLNLIQQLQQKVLKDPITGLANRIGFNTGLDELMLSMANPCTGTLLMVSIAKFERINDKAGREEGNTVLRRVGEVLQQVSSEYPQALLGRRQGTEFCLFVPNLAKTDASQFVQKVYDGVLSVEWKFQEEDPLIVHMGFSFFPEVEQARDMLMKADLALKNAQANDVVSCWSQLGDESIYSDESVSADKTNSIPLLSQTTLEWRALLEREIEHKTLPLVFQPIVSYERKVVGQEVFARLKNEDHLITARIFMPLVERFGLSVEFDQLVLNRVASLVWKIPSEQFVCVNLCVSSIQSQVFISWLDLWLSEQPEITPRLMIEIPEHAMRTLESVQRLAQVLHRHNVRLGIDHFGLDSTAFSYLASLPIHHAKVHHSFIKDIHNKPDNRFYIESLAQITRSRGVQLMVEGIENQNEWDAVMKLGIDTAQGVDIGQGIDAAQGFWLGGPPQEFL